MCIDNKFNPTRIKVNNLDIYFVRKSIFTFINKSLSNFHGSLLDIGCGKMPYKEFILKNSSVQNYVGLDIETAINYDLNIKPDFVWDGVLMPFEDAAFDCAIATEVLEHCPEPELVLNETYRVLKAGGMLFFTVPFLWNLHEVPNDEYRYTPFSLERHLSNSGFTNIQINALGGWNASLAQMIGLWVRRAPMSRWKRKVLSILFLPVYKYLIKKDLKPNSFGESTMITGLSGIAFKK